MKLKKMRPGRSGKKIALWVLGLTGGLLVATIFGDAPARVKRGEEGWSLASQWASAVAHVTVIPALLWAVASNSDSPWTWALPAASGLAGLFLFSRRIAASGPRAIAMGPRQLIARIRVMTVLPEMPVTQDGTPKPVPFNPWRTLLWTGAAAIGVSAAITFESAWAPHLPVALDLTTLAPWGPLGVYVGYLCLLVVFAVAGRLHREFFASDGDEVQYLTGRVAAAAGMAHAAFVTAGGVVTANGDRSRLVVEPVPDKLQRSLSDLEAGLRIHMADYVATSLRVERIVLEKVAVLGEDESARVNLDRATSERSNGLLVSAPEDSSTDPYTARGSTAVRPGAKLWRLGATVKPPRVEAFARTLGLTIVAFDDAADEAIVAQLDAKTLAIRDRLAAILNVPEFAVEIHVGGKIDCSRAGAVAMLRVFRSPIASRDAGKRREFWLEHAASLLGLPDGHLWRYTESPLEGSALLECVVDPLRDFIPYSADPGTPIDVNAPWVVGVDDDGEQVAIEIAGGAHMLIAGATRSGKSVATYSLITHILRMGDSARLLLADPNDTTIAPYADLVSWGSSSTHPAEVNEMLGWVRGELDRRKPILRALRTDKITEFSPEVPLIVVIIDEAANYMKNPDKAAALEFAGEIAALVAQAAKYGIRMVLITQRPAVTVISAEIRSQMATRISFRLEDKEAPMMVFPDIDNPERLLSFPVGIGLVREVGEQPRRFRAEYLADHWAAADRIQVPGIPIDVKRPLFIPGARPEATVVGEFDFSLDDLEPAEAEPVGARGLEFDFSFDEPEADGGLQPAPSEALWRA